MMGTDDESRARAARALSARTAYTSGGRGVREGRPRH
jgi:hypothetical protein